MDQPAQQFADRYSLVLDERWTEWFELPSDLALPGMFQQRVSAARLLENAPRCIWPGLMPPDALPVVGNGYGDWLCARVGLDGRVAEVIHWYHGGGDWIPVGANIEQAVLHDAVDQFRPVQQQMLRGAGEMLSADHLDQVRSRLAEADLQRWLTRGLPQNPSAPHDTLVRVLDALADNRYLDALHLMRLANWASAACSCDLIEATLQAAVTKEMQFAAAAQFGESPRAMAQALFDPEQFLAPKRPNQQLGDWQPADWSLIERVSGEIWQQRQDLAWAAELLGWCQQRRGEVHSALAVYFAGRLASSFTNQAVRMRTHWFNQRFGKFSIAQLDELASEHGLTTAEDGYLELFGAEPDELLERVSRYWQGLAGEHFAAGRYAEAYDCYYRAGWDLGAPAMREYHRILAGLIEAADKAGWAGRARVAETHLNCLLKRLRP